MSSQTHAQPMIIAISEEGYARGKFFTRNPSSGANQGFAEVFLKQAEKPTISAQPLFALLKAFPQTSRLLEERCRAWETELRDAVQVDFEISGQELRLGHPEPMRRSPKASLAIACGLAEENLISRAEALCRVRGEELASFLLPSFLDAETRQAQRQGRLLAQGSHGSGGSTCGVVAFDSDSVWTYSNQDKPVILVCDQLTCLHREALLAATGVLVARGPILAAKQFELPCVVIPGMKVEDGQVRFADKSLSSGDKVSLDGATARVFAGQLRSASGRLSSEVVTLLGWSDQVKEIEIRANVSSCNDVHQAIAYGATGIGLCRIEAFFLLPECLSLFQAAIKDICTGATESSTAVIKLTRALEEQAYYLFQACLGFNQGAITVRLFDAPLSQMVHHWLNHEGLAADYPVAPISDWLAELNPMQGLRGGRLSIVYRVLMRLQIRALLRAWRNAVAENASLKLQLMMPGVSDAGEVRILRECAQQVAQEEAMELPEIGSMLELPRACLTADALCDEADFLSFGTGDLTESTCGLSRYDSQLSFLTPYLEGGLYPRDPFGSIDQAGVGALMRLATEKVKAKRPDFELGTVGAQAIDAESLRFCCGLGLRFASVPAHHVPVARLVAAQVAVESGNTGSGEIASAVPV